MNFFKRKQNNKNDNVGEQTFQHELSRGDHVVRWSHIALYPIQIHGIVLSAGLDSVTIVDFGYTGKPTAKHDDKTTQQDEQQDYAVDDDNDDTRLEDMIHKEDRVMVDACDTMHKQHGAERISIRALVEEKEIKCWKKIKYAGEEDVLAEKQQPRSWKWPWQKKKEETEQVEEESAIAVEEEEKKETVLMEEEEDEEAQQKTQSDEFARRDNQVVIEDEKKHNEEDIPDSDMQREDEVTGRKDNNEVETNEEDKKHTEDDICDSEDTNNGNIIQPKEKGNHDGEFAAKEENNGEPDENDDGVEEAKITRQEDADGDDNNTTNDKKATDKTKKASSAPTLPKSDPAEMVLSRVRYLLTNPETLPPHHVLFSNSECIAVWCKTGRWSTLQASIFLHSTAAGNLKSAATVATLVGTSTVTQVVPAGGIAGWFGATTTTTVSLISVQPWLIPVVAGYGLVAVGMPYVILRKCKKQWEKTTTELTDGFWAWADTDIYVEAIKSWSGID